jgi:hypothetical protein
MMILTTSRSHQTRCYAQGKNFQRCWLRNGFPISPEMASMIADAIEGQAGALCALSASRLSAGNPHTGIENIHTRNITIGRAYEVARQKLPRGQAANIKHTLAVRYRVSEVTVREAVVYTRRWLKSMHIE